MSSPGSIESSAASGTEPNASAEEFAGTRRRQGLLRATWVVMRKDLLLEWRGRARINATLFFALLTLLMFSFAMGPDHKLLQRTAPGFLWLAIFMSSVMSLAESMRSESDNDALEGLKLLPLDGRALFLGKSLVNSMFLLMLAIFLVPAAVAVYGVEIRMGFFPLIGVLAVGSLAISAPGTLYAAIAVQARSRDVLLPLLLFPVLIPGLLASVKATTLVMQGDVMGELDSWLKLLGAFAVVYWSVCTLLFPRVME